MESGAIIASRFEIERLIGSGGMADVYRARDLASGRPIAIKFLRGKKRERAARFQREGAVLARLQHPHIVGYVAHGTTAQVAWLAMEWLEGESLDARLRE